MPEKIFDLMNLFELIGCVFIIVAGFAGSLLLGERFGVWGYVGGSPIGILAWFGFQSLMIGVGMIVRRLFGILPRCKNGTCRSHDYRIDPDSRNRELICKCGDRYRLSRMTLFFIDPERRISPYMHRKFLWTWTKPEA